jgi:peptidoglycan/xylan/chitin deacetylase (PgdA/CDA1 family)
LPEQLGARYLHGLSVTPDVFRGQMKWLAERCDVRTLGEGLDRLTRGESRSARPMVCVTFDDGYADNARIAAPILEELGLRGTFFIATDFVLRRQMLWFDRAAEAWVRDRTASQQALAACDQGTRSPGSGTFRDWMSGLKAVAPAARLQMLDKILSSGSGITELTEPMTVEEMSTMQANGHEIGSHSVSHPILPQLDDDQLRSEFADSKAELEVILRRPVPAFCYPNGSCDERVSRAAGSAGYGYACTTKAGNNEAGTDRLALHRVHIHASSVTGPSGKHSASAFGAVVWGLQAWARGRAAGLGIPV